MLGRSPPENNRREGTPNSTQQQSTDRRQWGGHFEHVLFRETQRALLDWVEMGEHALGWKQVSPRIFWAWDLGCGCKTWKELKDKLTTYVDHFHAELHLVRKVRPRDAQEDVDSREQSEARFPTTLNRRIFLCSLHMTMLDLEHLQDSRSKITLGAQNLWDAVYIWRFSAGEVGS